MGLRVVPSSCRSGRRTDDHQVDGRRDLQPHAGNVPGKQRLSAQRVSRPGFLALLRPGQRLSQPTHPRGDSGSPWIAGRGLHQLDQRFSSLRAPGRSTESSRNAIGRPIPQSPIAGSNRTRQPTTPGTIESTASRTARLRRCVAGANPQLPVGGPHATGCPGGHSSRFRNPSHATTLRPRTRTHRRLWPRVPAGTTTAPARCPLRATLQRRRFRSPTTQLGWTRGHGQESRS